MSSTVPGSPGSRPDRPGLRGYTLSRVASGRAGSRANGTAGSRAANPGIERHVADPNCDCSSALRRPAPQELNSGIALPPFGLSDRLLRATEAPGKHGLGQSGFLTSKTEKVPDRICLSGRQLSLTS